MAFGLGHITVSVTRSFSLKACAVDVSVLDVAYSTVLVAGPLLYYGGRALRALGNVLREPCYNCYRMCQS